MVSSKPLKYLHFGETPLWLCMTCFLLTILILIGPKFDHCQPLSRTDSLLFSDLIDATLADSQGMVSLTISMSMCIVQW